jgi:serine phosphatase RsbU (regulator of sigma subunit)
LKPNWQPVLAAAASAAVVFALGTGVESLVIRAVRGDRQELEWISDAVLAAAVAALAYLWLHLRQARSRVTALEREQIALDVQLRMAAEIQRSLLPAMPAATAGYRWAARMVPASRVGGDFYDFVQADGAVLAIVGDVSGKGMPAALIQSSLKMLFRMVVRDTGDPAAIAGRMSEALYEETGGLPYATAILARFEANPARLAYVNAGHPPGLVMRGDDARALDAGGPPLGLLPDAFYAAERLELRAGDFGVLVTDGITEAFEGASLSLPDLFRDRAPEAPSEACDRLLRAAGEAPGPFGVEGWQDDRTVLVFEVC